MAQACGNTGEESDPVPTADDDEAQWAAARQAVYERQRMLTAREATAVGLDESARSHERIAAMYEEIAERTSDADECRQCAGRHRAFATEDRHRAAQLRSAPGEASATRA
jgi:hypothetical protein